MTPEQRERHCMRLHASALTDAAREHYAALWTECRWFAEGDAT